MFYIILMSTIYPIDNHLNRSYYCILRHYSLFTFSWPQFENGSLRNGGMLILCIYFAVDGMPLEMYGESWIAVC